MSNQSLIKLRTSLRNELTQSIEQFLANGGVIHTVTTEEPKPKAPRSENIEVAATVRPPRRESLKLEAKIAEAGRALAEQGLSSANAARVLNSNWGVDFPVNAITVEQLAAKYGYHYSDNSPGRPSKTAQAQTAVMEDCSANFR